MITSAPWACSRRASSTVVAEDLTTASQRFTRCSNAGAGISIDYLRSARPVETFAQCELVRVGSRVALVQVRCWQTTPDNPIVVARGHFLLTEAGTAPDGA